MNKRGFELSFSTLFAIIAGAFILFIAIYATLNVVRSGQHTVNVVCAKQFTLLFEPTETGLASGKVLNVSSSIETRIFNKCYSDGTFGNQEFSCAEKSGLLKEWPNPGAGIKINNKYVFSEKIEQGNNFIFFSKPFSTAFKVSDILFMISKDYCFDSSPEFIQEEVKSLGISRIKLENCTGREIKVCFNSQSSGCNISVFPSCQGTLCENEYSLGYTVKGSKTMYFSDSLIYASIFSDPELYYCNVKRLGMRIQQLAKLFTEEQNFLVSRGCGSSSSSSLLALSQAAEQFDGRTSSSISNLEDASFRLELDNSQQGGCKIW